MPLWLGLSSHVYLHHQIMITSFMISYVTHIHDAALKVEWNKNDLIWFEFFVNEQIESHMYNVYWLFSVQWGVVGVGGGLFFDRLEWKVFHDISLRVGKWNIGCKSHFIQMSNIWLGLHSTYIFVTVEKLFGWVQSFAKRQKKRRYQENNKNICLEFIKIYIYFSSLNIL